MQFWNPICFLAILSFFYPAILSCLFTVLPFHLLHCGLSWKDANLKAKLLIGICTLKFILTDNSSLPTLTF